MRIEDAQPWTNNYWLDGEHIGQDEYYHVPAQVGEGVYVKGLGNRRFRVLDIWWSDDDDNGPVGLGRHVILKDVTGTDDDVVLALDPQYYAAKG